MGIFAQAQETYGPHGVAVFPVDAESKKPSILHPHRIGLLASAQLASKFPNSDALGFWAGARNRITVLDVDMPGRAGEQKLTEMMTRYGVTPLIVRSASGKYHAYYRHGGERRLIRIMGEPVDILGNGLVVAPPSRVARGSYEIINGTLDDLDRLPPMRPEAAYDGWETPRDVAEGRRNRTLWRHCMRSAHSCDDLEALLDVARGFNEELVQPLPDAEVVSTARSAWKYTEAGRNYFGRGAGARIARDEMEVLGPGSDALSLLTFLRMENGPDANFIVANGLRTRLRWSLDRISQARRRLIEVGIVEQIRGASSKAGPALHRWPRKGGQI